MRAEAAVPMESTRDQNTAHLFSFFHVVIVGVGGLHWAYVAAVAASQSCGAHTGRGGGVEVGGGQWMAAGVSGSLPLEIFISIKCIQGRAARAPAPAAST